MLGEGESVTPPWCGRIIVHSFFSAAVFSAEQVGLALAAWSWRCWSATELRCWSVVDDTLFKRAGKKVWAAGWFHDGSAKGPKPVGYGNNWVIAGIIVTLPMLDRRVCLPVLARLVVKLRSSAEAGPLDLSCLDHLPVGSSPRGAEYP